MNKNNSESESCAATLKLCSKIHSLSLDPTKHSSAVVITCVLFDLIFHTHIFLPLAFPSFHLLIKLANFDVENFFCRFLTKEREVNLLLSTEIKPRTSSIYFKK